MFKREISEELASLAKDYPVVTVLGPRQSGKTTLVRHVFADMPYVNLEEIDSRISKKMKWILFLKKVESLSQ